MNSCKIRKIAKNAVTFILIQLLAFSSYYSFGEEEFRYSLSVGGSTYDIPYKITNGQLKNIRVDLNFDEMVLEIEPSAKGRLDVSFPRDFIDQIGNVGRLTAYVSGEKVEYSESVTCDKRTISIEFGDNDQDILLMGPSLPYDETDLTAVLEVNFQGSYVTKVITDSNSVTCDWKLLAKEKEFQISVRGGSRLEITLPNSLLGGPYTVFLDGKETRFDLTSDDRYSTIAVRYSRPHARLSQLHRLPATTGIPRSQLDIVMSESSISLEPL
jgi:hypothetical protein